MPASAAPTALGLPASLGGLVPMSDLAGIAPGSAASIRAAASREAAAAVTLAASVSRAYGSVPAGARTYHDEGLTEQVLLVAVRKQSPGLYTTSMSAADAHFAAAPQEVRTVGAVQCLVANDPTPEGTKPAPDTVHVLTCQRTAAGKTVIVMNQAFDSALSHDPRAMAALVDTAWRSIA